MADIKKPDIKVLWAKSGNRCAMCSAALTHESDISNPKPVGQQAHIKGENSGKGKVSSARYDEKQSDEERNSYGNLILLCPTCHTIIDKNEAEYTVERLHVIKDLHERKVSEAIRQKTLEVTYFELEHTLRHLIKEQSLSNYENFDLIPPKDKIVKNNLSAGVEKFIQAGLLGAKQVEDFLNKNADMDYSQKLREAFVKKYIELKEDGQSGDTIFYSLLNTSSNYNPDARYMAAGLNVLSYYFQLCEVFEK